MVISKGVGMGTWQYDLPTLYVDMYSKKEDPHFNESNVLTGMQQIWTNL